MDARAALDAVVSGKTLARAEADSAMASVMRGEATPAQLGALLAALRVRGETVEEIAGFATAMRAASVRVEPIEGAIDTCGTGGDGSNSFNISTVAAVVAAAAGARVAKHGNRAASSACGSADVLEELGVRIDLGPDEVRRCVLEVGIGFMFAPRYHPAMRHAGPVRKEIGIRTVFNVLGPLANPARVRRQLLGAPSTQLAELLVAALAELGAERVLVVHGGDGLDEISPAGPTETWELRDGAVTRARLDVRDLGLEPAAAGAITGGDARANAEIAREVLRGTRGGPRTAVLLNAGAACYVAGIADTVREGVARAAATLDDGSAQERLERFVQLSRHLGEAAAK